MPKGKSQGCTLSEAFWFLLSRHHGGGGICRLSPSCVSFSEMTHEAEVLAIYYAVAMGTDACLRLIFDRSMTNWDQGLGHIDSVVIIFSDFWFLTHWHTCAFRRAV